MSKNAIKEGAAGRMGASFRVLVCHPSPDLRADIQDRLVELGITQVTMAANEREAMAALCFGAPDMVVTDWRLPPVNGFEFIQAVRRNARSLNPRLPILLVAERDGDVPARAVRDTGASGAITLPMDADLLRGLLSDALHDSRRFVDCDGYTGPDRRNTGPVCWVAEDRRRVVTDLLGDTFDGIIPAPGC